MREIAAFWATIAHDASSSSGYSMWTGTPLPFPISRSAHRRDGESRAFLDACRPARRDCIGPLVKVDRTQTMLVHIAKDGFFQLPKIWHASDTSIVNETLRKFCGEIHPLSVVYLNHLLDFVPVSGHFNY
jgi:hypothetical protein